MCDELTVWRVDRPGVTSWPFDEFTGSPRRRCLGMSQTLVKELTVEDGADFRSSFQTDIKTFQNLWCMTTPYIEKEDSDLRPCVTVRERLQISCYRYWLTALSYIPYGTSLGWWHVLGPITWPVSYGVKTLTHPYAARIATVLQPYWWKSITCQPFLRILGKNFHEHGSRYTQPCGACTTRPYYMALHNGRHTGR